MKSRKEDSEFLEEKQHVIDVANELHKKGYFRKGEQKYDGSNGKIK